MYRSLLITLAALFALATLPAAADVNLHNGYVIVRNESEYPLYFSITNELPGLGSGVRVQEHMQIAPHSTHIANGCCYAAGSTYRFVAYYANNYVKREYFVARLCNERGIPHGFASLTVRSQEKTSTNNTIVHLAEITRTDNGCP